MNKISDPKIGFLKIPTFFLVKGRDVALNKGNTVDLNLNSAPVQCCLQISLVVVEVQLVINLQLPFCNRICVN